MDDAANDAAHLCIINNHMFQTIKGMTCILL